MQTILPNLSSIRFCRSIQCVTVVLCIGFGTIAPAESPQVRPIDRTKFSSIHGIPANDAFGKKLVRLIQKHAKYTLQEINDPANFIVQEDFPGHIGLRFYWPYTNSKSKAEFAIRPLSNFAYGMAIMLKTGIYDPQSTGVTANHALERTILAINGCALTHRGNGNSGNHRWGGGGKGSDSTRWQAAYWAAQTAGAAWLLWDDLPEPTRRLVATMLEYEADSFIDYKVPYWRNVDGTTNSPGDTKAEENSWNTMPLALAQAMMPDHPHVHWWRRKASELQVSANAILADNSSIGRGRKIVDGKPVHQWINGYNMFDDGIVVNHRMVQPDYMIGPSTIGYVTAITASLANQYIPPSTFHNADLIYRGLTETQFKPGPSPYGGSDIVPPGGTIYQRSGSGQAADYSPLVYCPQAQDWVQPDVVLEGYLNFDLFSEFLGLDKGKDFDAMGWAKARLDRLIAMQARSGEAGNIYQPGDWVSDYFSQEQSIFMSITEAWLLHWLITNQKMSPIGENWGPLTTPDERPRDAEFE